MIFRSTYEPIATTTASGSTNSISFNSIPGTYTRLVIVANLQHNGPSNNMEELRIRFNNDSGGSSYQSVRWFGKGGYLNTGGETASSYQCGYFSSTSYTPTVSRINVLNYVSSNQTKQMITQWSSLGAADPYLFYNGGIWNSNSTVTSIQLSTFYG